jgi:hypothetical protein
MPIRIIPGRAMPSHGIIRSSKILLNKIKNKNKMNKNGESKSGMTVSGTIPDTKIGTKTDTKSGMHISGIKSTSIARPIDDRRTPKVRTPKMIDPYVLWFLYNLKDIEVEYLKVIKRGHKSLLLDWTSKVYTQDVSRAARGQRTMFKMISNGV